MLDHGLWKLVRRLTQIRLLGNQFQITIAVGLGLGVAIVISKIKMYTILAT